MNLREVPSGDGPMRSRANGGTVDTEALSQAFAFLDPAADGASKPLTRQEQKARKKEIKKLMAAADREFSRAKKGYASEAKKERSKQKKHRKTIQQQLKERDKELVKKTSFQRAKRRNAKDTASFLGYESMFSDGICEVESGLFSRTISFSDISYQSGREDTQKEIFNSLCGLLDYFGAESMIQWNVINTPLLKEEIGSRKFFDPSVQETESAKEDAAILNKILNDKMKEGVSNIKRERYLTFSVGAASADDAVPMLARMEADSSNSLSRIGSYVKTEDGTNRLKTIHSQIRPGKPFIFDYDTDITLGSPQTTKDIIAPSMIDFAPEGEADHFVSEDMYGQILVMRRFGSELSDRALSEIVDLPLPMNVAIHLQPMDKAKSVALVKKQLAWIDKEIIEEQRTAVNKGYDFTILPPELQYSKEEAGSLLDHLQNKNQRLYTFTGLIYTYAPSKEELDNQILQIISVARKNSIDLEPLKYRQREGLNSVLPLGHNHVQVSRMFTTAQAAIFMPFNTAELDHPGGLYAGQSKLSNNLVMINRKLLASPMGYVSGKPGAGKGVRCKTEIACTRLANPDDQIFVVDRAGEYTLVTENYDGTVIKLGVDSSTFMNPFDLAGLGHMTREAAIAFKVDAILAQAGASAEEAGRPLSEGDQSIIQRCVEKAYSKAEAKEAGSVPLLENFYRLLREQPEPQAEDIALRYERYVSGTMDFFNKHSNVDFEKKLIDINLKELPDSMLVFALVNICEAIRNQMYRNFDRGISTWLYLEETQSFFKYATVLNYFSRLNKEGRKFGLLLTGITQNSVAMLEKEEARDIVLNADYIMLLKQSPLDRKAWVDFLSLSPTEEKYIDESTNAGDGLLIVGAARAEGATAAARIPIKGKFPDGNKLYDLFSTDPNETADDKKRAAALREAALHGNR